MTDFVENIGKQLIPGNWFTIDQARINAFADVTLDHQYIHVDEERAAKTELGGTIAHGFLILSLMPGLIKDSLLTPNNMVMGINYGFNKVRFLNPVHCHDEIRLMATIESIEQRGDNGYLQQLATTVEIKGKDKPALACEWLNYFVCE